MLGVIRKKGRLSRSGRSDRQNPTVNSVCAVVYFVIGTFLSYLGFQALILGTFVAIASLAILLPLLWLCPKESTRLDSCKWTRSSTKGTVAFVTTVLCCLPEYRLGNSTTWIFNSFYFLVAGVILGVSLYFQDYLKPVTSYGNSAIEEKALDMEHREVLALLAFAGTSMMVLFGSVLAGYILGQFNLSNVQSLTLPIKGVVRYLILGLYPAIGFILWILRPFHARAREIRIALKQSANLTRPRKLNQ